MKEINEKIKNSEFLGSNLRWYDVLRAVKKSEECTQYMGLHKVTNRIVTIYKYVNASGNTKPSRALKQTEMILKKFSHCEYLPQLLDLFRERKDVYMVTNNFNGISLKKWTKSNEISEDVARLVFFRICKGVSHMHKSNIFHKSLNLTNIFIEGGNQIMIRGIRTARLLNLETSDKFSNYHKYLAPEVFDEEAFLGLPVDI